MTNTKMLLCALLGIVCAQVAFIQSVPTSNNGWIYPNYQASRRSFVYDQKPTANKSAISCPRRTPQSNNTRSRIPSPYGTNSRNDSLKANAAISRAPSQRADATIQRIPSQRADATMQRIPSKRADSPMQRTPSLRCNATIQRIPSLSTKTTSPTTTTPKPSTTSKAVSSKKEYNLIAPGITDFTSISDYSNFQREWQTNNSKVSIKKDTYGTSRLEWQVDDLTVRISTNADGYISQKWKFGEKDEFNFIREANKSETHIWKIGDQTYKYLEAVTGDVVEVGSIPYEGRIFYENRIIAWCRANLKFLVNPSECLMYKPKPYDFIAREITNFTSINDYPTFRGKWEVDYSKVRINKKANGTIKLNWQVRNVTVEVDRESNVKITQTWKFGKKVEVVFNHDADKFVEHKWNIGGQEYKYQKLGIGEVFRNGKIPKEEKLYYENQMMAWCQENQKFFVTLSECAIYEEK